MKKDITKIEFIVTRDDYEKGIPGDNCQCAIARSIRRTLGTKKLIEVTKNEIRVGEQKFQVSKDISKLLIKFDSEIKFEGCEILDKVLILDEKPLKALRENFDKALRKLHKEFTFQVNKKFFALKPFKFKLISFPSYSSL